ncbi:MAG TPA: YetF domain-containing protein [Verrucomicrobiae bacterium]|nr:YetF domain-containing protein [Verrucomicrobiae bacterium]
MNAVFRALIVYFFLLIVFRIAGKRTLAQSSSFELVLLLIISETVQQAMVDDDHSITTGLLLSLTLVSISIALSWLKQRYPKLDRWLEEEPLIILENGKPHRDRMNKVRVDESEILAAARRLQGLTSLDEIKYAILEGNGEITIVPKRQS